MEQAAYEKRGYLTEDFHLFHLKDQEMDPVNWHYHTYYNKFGQESRTASPAFPPSRA